MAALRQLFAYAVLALALPAAAQDTRAIQIREAQRADERTFAYFEKFRHALVARFGADPLLAKLKFDEQEAQALVYAASGAPPEHVIWQAGNWIATDGRELKAWAPGADPAIARFRLSAVKEALLREKFRAYRTQPARAADHLGAVTIGYFGNPFNRLIAEVMVVGMSSFGLTVIAFDLATGQSLDVAAAIAGARAKREATAAAQAAAASAAAKRDLRSEVPAVLAAFRRDVGTGRLMAVWITRTRITFIQSDRAMFDYDRLGSFERRERPYDSVFLCAEGFADSEVDWGALSGLVEIALRAGKLDEEDREHGEISVERPRDCKPTAVEVKFTNYVSPYPSSAFEPRGKLLRAR